MARTALPLGMGNFSISWLQDHEHRLALSADAITTIPVEFNSLHEIEMTVDLYKGIADAALWYSCYNDTCTSSDDSDTIVTHPEWAAFGPMYAVVLADDFWTAKNELIEDDIDLDLTDFIGLPISNARALYHPELKLFTFGSESYGGSNPVAIVLSYQKEDTQYRMHVLRSTEYSNPGTTLLTRNGTWLEINEGSSYSYMYEHQDDFTKWEFVLEDQGNCLMKIISSKIIRP